MRQQTTRISPEDISRQLQYCREVAALSAARPAQPLAFVDTYGCQQNEADSERIRGYAPGDGLRLHPGRGAGPDHRASTPAPSGSTQSSGCWATWAPWST